MERLVTNAPCSPEGGREEPLGGGLWQAIHSDLWHWAQWEDGYSLFCGETGDTYMLDELAGLILQHVSRGAKSAEWLWTNLGQMCGLAVNRSWRNKILASLRSLEQLELVECVSAAELGWSGTQRRSAARCD